jgi:WD40-like Beta Propeller Repeat
MKRAIRHDEVRGGRCDRSHANIGALALAAATLALACGDGTRIVLGQGPLPGAGPFGAPVVVAELSASSANDFKESLTADMLEVYFCSDRPGGPGGQDVWVATRARTNDPWTAPRCLVDVSSPSLETGTAIAADGLTLWLASDRPGGTGGLDIWVSTRSSRGSPWSTPAPVSELNTTGDEFPRPPAESGLVMPPSYRAAPYNKYQTSLTSRADAAAPWTMPVRLAEIDTSPIDTDAFLTEDGLVLYLSSDRVTAGDQDLFVASRPDLKSPFGQALPLAELNAKGAQDRDPWLSPDGHEIYFSSDRGGTLKIYRAVR